MLRMEEVWSLRKFHIIQAVSNILLEFLPIACSAVAIVVYTSINNEKLEPSTAFSLVNVLTQLTRPIRLLVNVIDANMQYKKAFNSFELLYESVGDIPENPVVEDLNLLRKHNDLNNTVHHDIKKPGIYEHIQVKGNLRARNSLNLQNKIKTKPPLNKGFSREKSRGEFGDMIDTLQRRSV